ncbi:ferritin-like domain-containing protein [Anaeromyxobacter oryzae]|uniref:DUF2383 domain-containing protein n=1 Tax=Anaeromyxobacter oryzae TaxID=2918170 RepID=A0ABM7WRV4_9BACT|nr:ferritin-like domain-containing protein [Anaeromyxobacter oryzae]BDG02210.1 hypothetical protein AMOR_12060 [Anaeromyxobacter oryzae]
MADENDRQEEGQEEPLLSDVEVLASLARLDLEAALAYEAAAEVAEDGELAAQLRRFGEDHRRHVDGLASVLEREGAAELAPSEDTVAPMLAGLARLAAPLGPESLVLAILADEQLTNLSYEDALAYDWDEDEEQLLEGFRADEERHMRWLSDRHDAFERTVGDLPEAPG